MPQVVTGGTLGGGNTGAENNIEIMRNITYITKEYGMGFNEIMNLPYIVFLSYLKQARVTQLESSEEGRRALKQGEMVSKTEPDLARVRQYT